MRRTTLLSLFILIFGLFGLGANAHAQTPDEAFQPAPSWTLKDAEGNNVSLADYRGKPLILHFWATWCPYCKKVQPGLSALHAKYQSQGLELVGISVREDAGAQPQQVLQERGHTFKTLLFGETAAEAYGVPGTPTTFFINQKGQLIGGSNSSNPDDPVWEEAITYMLANP